MARGVFVIGEPKGNRIELGKYGEVTQVCSGWIDNKDLGPALESLVETLKHSFKDGDFVVMGGHAKLNMVAFHFILEQHHILRQLLPKGERWYTLTHDGREDNAGNQRKWWLPI